MVAPNVIRAWISCVKSQVCVSLLVCCAFIPISAASLTFAQTQYYVDKDATDDNDTGLSWEESFKTLQKMLSVVEAGDIVWIADGNYYPDEGPGQSNGNRNSSFTIPDGVKLYGGFQGVSKAGGGESDVNERNFRVRLTILNGDLSQNDDPNFGDYSENAYNVVTASYTGFDTLIDGVTIRGGNAESSVGAGVLVFLGKDDTEGPRFRNVVFTQNMSESGGAGLYGGNTDLDFRYCTFDTNVCDEPLSAGGAMVLADTVVSMSNCSVRRHSPARVGRFTR